MGGRYLPSLPLAFAIARFFDMTVDKMVDPADEEEGVGGFSYLLGLSNYGVGEEVSADDADDGHQVRSPVSH